MATEALQGYCEAVTADFYEKLPAPTDIAKIKTQEGEYIVPILLNVDTIKC